MRLEHCLRVFGFTHDRPVVIVIYIIIIYIAFIIITTFYITCSIIYLNILYNFNIRILISKLNIF